MKKGFYPGVFEIGKYFKKKETTELYFTSIDTVNTIMEIISLIVKEDIVEIDLGNLMKENKSILLLDEMLKNENYDNNEIIIKLNEKYNFEMMIPKTFDKFINLVLIHFLKKVYRKNNLEGEQVQVGDDKEFSFNFQKNQRL
jgi:hypothetical protein